MSPHWRRRLYVLLFVATALTLGATAKEQLGFSFGSDGLDVFRQWVESLNGWAPAVFVAIVVFRLFIGLTSHIVLTLGGLAFGITGGILWGALGLLLSALMVYALAAVLGPDWAQRRFGDQYEATLQRIERLGAMALFATMAHPLGPLTPLQLGAGLVGMSPLRYAAVIAVAAPIRSAPYVFLGTAVLDLTLVQSLGIGAALLALFVLPLLHPKVRRWILGDAAPPEERSQER